eukprot:1234982-Ditylum_brightwellii.AAC.1
MSLRSVGKLCDANFITIFDQDKVTVHRVTQQRHDTIKTIHTTDAAIMVGNRDLHNGLWRVNLKVKPAVKIHSLPPICREQHP